VDPTIIEAILQDRKIAYAIADRKLNVVALGGEVELISATRIRGECTLFDLTPELVGNEATLADILAGQLPRFELAWVNRDTVDGKISYLTMVELPYRDHNGQIVGIVHLVDDVTEMGSLKQHLAQQRNELRLLRDELTRQNLELGVAITELQELDELKSRFISVAAHELRTPLTSISGYLEVLLEEEMSPLTSDQREYIEIVRSSTDRMLNIITNLLDVTRIEAGRIELVLQPADLSKLVQAVVAEIKPQLEAKAKRLKLHAAPDLPPALCDKNRAIQIIENLLSNAAKYTPQESQIAVNIALAKEEGFLEISVVDNGVGISAEDQDKIFSRFFRSKSAVAVGASGAGLGLHITRSLVELHGGRIWFESKLGQGSTFHVTFPIAG